MIRSRTQLLAELGAVADSPRKAKAALDRAVRVVGLERRDALTARELLLICEALGAEGGPVQQWAEALAADALRTAVEPEGPRAA